jgi:hypothetical protein
VPVFDLIGESYPLPSKGVSTQRTINYMVEIFPNVVTGDPKTKVPKILKCLPGMRPIKAKILDRRCRGQYVSSTGPDLRPRLYAVYGPNVVRYREDLSTYDIIGQVADADTPVSMTDNGFFFVIAAGGGLSQCNLKALDGAATMFGISLPPAPGLATPMAPTMVAFIKQRVVINTGIDNQWAYSDLPNAQSVAFQADSFYSAEACADPINAIVVCDGSIWIFGPRSYEIWRTQDDQDSPFTSVGGNSGAIGCAAGASVAVIDNEVYWLGGSDIGAGGVYVGTGLTATRISNPGIESLIETFVSRDTTIGYTYSDAGQTYYVLTFLYGTTSVAFGKSAGWHERMTKDLNSSATLPHSCLFPVKYADKLYAGCLYNDGLFQFDSTYALDYDGRTIKRIRIAPVLHKDMLEVLVSQITLDMDVGTTTSATDEPQIQLEISRDGGNTYGPIYAKSIGRQGQYKKTVKWLKGAGSKALVMQLTFESDTTIANIFQARVDYTVCIAS